MIATAVITKMLRKCKFLEERQEKGGENFIFSMMRIADALRLLGRQRREGEEGKVFLSTRAVPGYDCAQVCAVFGGGGHKGAAGGNTTLPLAEATEIMVAEMKKQFER